MKKQTIAALFKRVETLEQNQEKPWKMTFVYTDGRRVTMKYDIMKFLDIVVRGTAKSGVIDVIAEYQTEGYDGFFDAFKENGIYPDLSADMIDDSNMLQQEGD